jgi:hypothetical protein
MPIVVESFVKSGVATRAVWLASMPAARAMQKWPADGFVTPVTFFERVSVPSTATNRKRARSR